MINYAVNPVLFQVGPFAVRYYGLIYALGILLSFLVVRHLARKRQLPLTSKDFDELFLISTLAVVIGSRLGNVLSELGYYSAHPFEVFAFWNGGMAFHGGFAALILVGLYFSRKKKISFYDLADIVVIPAALALAFGRIANFLNGEFYGTPSGLPWAVKFSNVDLARHPVQIYEAIKNLGIFVALWQLQRLKSLPRGMLFWAFVFLYGLIRFFLEFLKDVPVFAFGFKWGQVWCIPMVLVGGFMLWRLLRNKNESLKAAPEIHVVDAK